MLKKTQIEIVKQILIQVPTRHQLIQHLGMITMILMMIMKMKMSQTMKSANLKKMNHK